VIAALLHDAALCLGDGAWLPDLEPMPGRQRAVAIVGAAVIVLLVFELVRRRKLREEYSWVWIATAAAVTVLALEQDLLLTLTSWVGAASSASTLFFGGIVFLMALCVQFSVRLSRLTHRQRTLAQRLALLEEEVHDLRKRSAKPQANEGHDAAREQPAKAASRDEVA